MKTVALSFIVFMVICGGLLAKTQPLDSLYQIAKKSGDLNYVISLTEKLESSSKNRSEFKEMAKFHFLIGYRAKYLEDYKTSIKHYKLSLKIASKYDDLSRQRKCAVNISKLYQHLGQYKTAIPFTKEALRIAEFIRDDEKIARYNYDLGIIYRKTKELDKSILNLEKALTTYRNLNSPYWQGLTLIEMGNCETLLKRKKEAEQYYYQALNLNDTVKEIRAKVYHNHAVLLIESGDTIKSIAMLKKAVELKEDIGDKNLLISSLNGLGIYFYQKTKYDSSIFYLTKAFHSNELSEKDASSEIEFLRSYSYLDSIKRLTKDRYLLVDLGIYDKYDKYSLKKLESILSVEDEDDSAVASLVNERLEREAEKDTFIWVIVGLTLLIFVILLIALYREWKNRNIKKNIMETIRKIDSLD